MSTATVPSTRYLVAHHVETRQAEDGDRPSIHTYRISTTGIKRDGMSIPGSAWELDNFRRYSRVLAEHHGLPIGKVVSLTQTDDYLDADITFSQSRVIAREIEGLIHEDMAPAASVGFQVHEFEPDGRTVKRAELFEVSMVGVPADFDALHLGSRLNAGGLVSVNGLASLEDGLIFPTSEMLEPLAEAITREMRKSQHLSNPNHDIITTIEETEDNPHYDLTDYATLLRHEARAVDPIQLTDDERDAVRATRDALDRLLADDDRDETERRDYSVDELPAGLKEIFHG